MLPCDIVFTRTDNFLYNQSRSFLGIEYDHVAVVINNEERICFDYHSAAYITTDSVKISDKNSGKQGQIAIDYQTTIKLRGEEQFPTVSSEPVRNQILHEFHSTNVPKLNPSQNKPDSEIII